MLIRRIDHVQAALAGRGGVWYELGDTQLHLGTDPDFRLELIEVAQ